MLLCISLLASSLIALSYPTQADAGLFVSVPNDVTRSLEKRQTDDVEAPVESNRSTAKITSLRIQSDIQFRYSRTVIRAAMKNAGKAAGEISFSTFVPESAFISNFSMVLDGTEYVAEVKEKEKAKQDYEAAVDDGLGAGLVEQDVRNANAFTVSANVEPEGKVEFILTYDELLQRNLGQYEQVINVSPGQIVKDFEVVFNINESLPLTKVDQGLRTSNDIEFDDSMDKSVGAVERDVDGNPAAAKVTFKVSPEKQLEQSEFGLTGEFVVSYDVDRQNQTSEVQVIDGYFVHFFAPENLEVLPKHVIFVLDISGSMAGEKLTQMKDAMFTILNDMTEADYFNILLFDDDVQRWDGGQEDPTRTLPIRGSKNNVKAGIDFVVSLQERGSTNINDALLDALSLANETREAEVLPKDVQTMIVFLTDGQATVGVTVPDEIEENVKVANEELGTPIFGIAFGRDADFNLLKNMASDSDGFAKQIYEGSDAAIQLEDFFAQIASPLITGLNFNYVGGLVDNDTITKTELTTFFKGGEFIVAGKLDEGYEASEVPLAVEVAGSGAGSQFTDRFSICLRPLVAIDKRALPDNVTEEEAIDPFFEPDILVPIDPIDALYPCLPNPPVVVPRRTDAQNFLKNLYAFLHIKQLLKKGDNESRDDALALALENNFVTEVTSLIVRRPDTDRLAEVAPPTPLFGFQSASFSAFSTTPVIQNKFGIAHHRPALLPAPTGFFASGGGAGGGFGAQPIQVDYDSYADSYAYEREEAIYDFDNVTLFDTDDNSTIECTGNVTFFSKTYYRGEEVTFDEDNPDMFAAGGDMTVSAKVEGDCCWILFGEPDYGQDSVRHVKLEPEVEYRSVTSLQHLRENVKSIKKVFCR